MIETPLKSVSCASSDIYLPAKNNQLCEANKTYFLGVQVFNVFFPETTNLEPGAKVTFFRAAGKFTRPKITAVTESDVIIKNGVGYGGHFNNEPVVVFDETNEVTYIWNGAAWQKKDFDSGDDLLELRATNIIESTSFTVPDGVYKLTVTVVAPGGGGGESAGYYSYGEAGGAGGGSGEVIESVVLDVEPGEVLPCIIGVPGIGGGYRYEGGRLRKAADGSDAGNSVFGPTRAGVTLEAEGGKGGEGGHLLNDGMDPLYPDGEAEGGEPGGTDDLTRGGKGGWGYISVGGTHNRWAESRGEYTGNGNTGKGGSGAPSLRANGGEFPGGGGHGGGVGYAGTLVVTFSGGTGAGGLIEISW